VILTVDLGTSVTKIVVWGEQGQAAVGRCALECRYSAGNRAEQDPASWWPSVLSAAAEARAVLGTRADAVFGAVEALGFAAARQTFVPVAADTEPLGPALLWSDRRAGTEAGALAASFGPDGAVRARRRTGVMLDAGSVAAKVAWLERHEPERLTGARWLLSPRDLIVWRLTGEVCSDDTLASATGLFAMTDRADGPGGDGDECVGPLLAEFADALRSLGRLLPQSRPSESVVGDLRTGPAAELGLRPGIPVVIGAGDRACEVLGTGACETWPMVSWGTTANVSVPVDHVVGGGPEAMIVTRGALGGWLLEGGLSAAGSLLDWLGRLAGLDAGSLMERARTSPPGAGGVMVLPWFGGARAPWWRDTARGAVLGLSLDHDVHDMARAVVESVAFDVARCLEAAAARPGAGALQGVVLGGGGAGQALWTEVLAAVTGLPTRRRRSGEAASAGAATIVARATGSGPGHDDGEVIVGVGDVIVDEVAPDASLVARYAALRPAMDAAARAIIELDAQ
jgi:xylulokinase